MIYTLAETTIQDILSNAPFGYALTEVPDNFLLTNYSIFYWLGEGKQTFAVAKTVDVIPDKKAAVIHLISKSQSLPTSGYVDAIKTEVVSLFNETAPCSQAVIHLCNQPKQLASLN